MKKITKLINKLSRMCKGRYIKMWYDANNGVLYAINTTGNELFGGDLERDIFENTAKKKTIAMETIVDLHFYAKQWDGLICAENV